MIFKSMERNGVCDEKGNTLIEENGGGRGLLVFGYNSVRRLIKSIFIYAP